MSLIPLGFWAASGGGAAGGFDLLETQTLASSAASVTFTGLDSYSDYKHLQIRAIARDNRYNPLSLSYFRLNGATTGYGLGHSMYVDGATAGAVYSAQIGASSYMETFDNFTGATAVVGNYGVAVLDILDFSNTSKYTTTRLLGGNANGTTGQINIKSGLYMNTAAITSIAFTSTTSFVSGSRWSLYGVK